MADYRKYYRGYMYMRELLESDFTHNYIEENLKDGDKGKDMLIGKTSEKVIDMEWVVAIEDTLPYISKAIDEQRRFIKQVENVVRIEKAKKIGTDSVKHLAQHTNFIAKVEGDMVTPNKILTIEREESFAIYENRVLMTLIHKALRFVDDKYSKMKDVPNDSSQKMRIDRHLELDQQVVDISVNFENESHETLADDLDVLDVKSLSDFDRIRRIRTTLNEFLSTPLMKEIAKEPEVRPPITQTNLLKKNPNFKKAMELWNFLDSYKKDGFEIVGEEYDGSVSNEIKQDVYFSMSFQHFMLTLAMNPALRKMLNEKYEEENARRAEEEGRPERAKELMWEAKLEAVRKEEMELRLKEIREREKKILELTNEVKNLKITIDQKEQQIIALKGQVSVLKEQLEETKKELQETKIKLLEALKRIEELEAENAALKQEVERLNAKISELENEIVRLNKTIDEQQDKIRVLLQENAAQKAKIEEQQAVIDEQNEKIAFLENRIGELTEELSKYRENIRELESEVARQQTVIEKQQAEIKSANEKSAELEANLKAEISAHKNDLEQQKSEYDARLAQQAEEFEERLREARENFNAEIEAQKLAHDEAVFAAKKDYETKLLDAQVGFDREKNDMQKASAKQLDAQKKLYESKLLSVTKDKNKAYAVEERKFKAKLAKLEKQMGSDYNKKLKAVRTQARQEAAAAKKKAAEEIKLVKAKARKKQFTKEELEES